MLSSLATILQKPDLSPHDHALSALVTILLKLDLLKVDVTKVAPKIERIIQHSVWESDMWDILTRQEENMGALMKLVSTGSTKSSKEVADFASAQLKELKDTLHRNITESKEDGARKRKRSVTAENGEQAIETSTKGSNTSRSSSSSSTRNTSSSSYHSSHNQKKPRKENDDLST